MTYKFSINIPEGSQEVHIDAADGYYLTRILFHSMEEFKQNRMNPDLFKARYDEAVEFVHTSTIPTTQFITIIEEIGELVQAALVWNTDIEWDTPSFG